MGAWAAKGRANDVHDPFDVAKHLVVPKSKNAVPFFFEKPSPVPVQGSTVFFTVLATINFDHEPELVAREIREIGADGCLAPKM